MPPSTRTAPGEHGEAALRRDGTGAKAERLCLSVGLLLVVLCALALIISLLAALRGHGVSALMLIFAGGGLLFGLLGGCCLLLATKLPAAPEVSRRTHRETRSSKDSLHEKGTRP